MHPRLGTGPQSGDTTTEDVRMWGALLVATVAAVLLVPFLLAGPAVDRWFDSYRDRVGASGAAAAIVVALLAADIVAPVPSSIVSAFAGVTFGPVAGSVLAFVGLSIGCVFGYAIARRIAPGLARTALGARALEHATRLRDRDAMWTVVATRPIPLLAEATVVAAGLSRIRPARFIGACLAANAMVALLFAGLPAVLT